MADSMLERDRFWFSTWDGWSGGLVFSGVVCSEEPIVWVTADRTVAEMLCGMSVGTGPRGRVVDLRRLAVSRLCCHSQSDAPVAVGVGY